MKRLVASLVLLVCCFSIVAQSDSSVAPKFDTLFTDKKKIPCKIVEIGENEIKYQRANVPDGPIYVIDKSNVRKYTLSTGFSELLLPDELAIDQQHKEILGNRQVIKVHPFSLVSDHVSMAYEKVLKVGTNLDIEVGYINSNITQSETLGNGINTSFNGSYVKAGCKFLIGQDFTVKGIKYAHPLKGRYIKLDVAASYLNYSNFQRIIYNYNSSQPVTTTTVTSGLRAVSYGLFINYGRQFILGNILTLDYYIGVGMTGLSYNYSNPQYQTTGNAYGYRDEGKYLSNFYGFMRIPNLGLSGTAGLRIGYIIPEGKNKKNAERVKK